MSRLAVVVAPQNRGWILERMGREVAAQWGEGAQMVFSDGSNLPVVDRYFFTHWSVAVRALDHDRRAAQRAVVLFTHPPPNLWRKHTVLRALRSVSVASMSSVHARRLRQLGVPGRRVHVVLPGSEPDTFLPHSRGAGAIGMNAAYYERKSPRRIHSLVRYLQHRQFLLLGRDWEQWPGFSPLLDEPNFEYVEAPIEDYPRYYERMDVFVSLSTMEGGPIPMLEAMLSNAVPVVTDTGFGRDLIQHGRNGFLLPVRSPTRTHARFVERAFDLTADVRSTVDHLTWSRFGEGICSLLQSIER